MPFLYKQDSNFIGLEGFIETPGNRFVSLLTCLKIGLVDSCASILISFFSIPASVVLLPSPSQEYQ